MRKRTTVLVSVLAGAVLGAAGVQALHAQAKPPAFVIGEIDVRDAEVFAKDYLPTASRTIRDGGGKCIVGGGKSVSFYGEPPKRIAVMVFESLEKAEATFNSKAYKTAKAAGDKVATFRIYVMEGIPQ
ncbi:MAG: DUF1330 domain-containing protein [Reyranella sp.]|nr:DUF1330 domain-containing protein [Reyranella sp.]